MKLNLRQAVTSAIVAMAVCAGIDFLLHDTVGQTALMIGLAIGASRLIEWN